MEWSILIAALGTIVPLIIAWRAQKSNRQKALEIAILQADIEKSRAEAEKTKSQGLQALADAEQSRAEAVKFQSEASQAASQSVNLLLDPLNARIVSLEGGMNALNEEARTLRDEREVREKKHQDEITAMKAVQSTMRTEISELRGGIIVLVAQLESEGLVPRYRPKTGPLPELI